MRSRRVSVARYTSPMPPEPKSGKYREATESLVRAIRLDPRLAEAFNNLACVYFKLGEYKDALGLFEQALRLKPDFAEVRFNLRVVYLTLRDKRAAIGQHALLGAMNPDLAKRLYLGIFEDKVVDIGRK